MSILLEISKKCIEIARRWPRREDVNINSFALFTDWKEGLNADNFLQTYRSGIMGHYWSRIWEASGYDPDKICADFDLLFLQRLGTTESPCKGQYTAQFNIGIAMPFRCEGCDEKRTQFEADTAGAGALSQIIKELSTVKFYRNLDFGLGDGIQNYNLSDSEVADLKEQGATISTIQACGGWKQLCTETDFSYTNWGGNNLTIVSARLSISGCHEEQLILSPLNEQQITQIANTKCNVC